jgi:hypothetical protein
MLCAATLCSNIFDFVYTPAPKEADTHTEPDKDSFGLFLGHLFIAFIFL